MDEKVSADVVANKLFIVDFMLKAVNGILLKDSMVVTYCEMYGIDVKPISTNINHNAQFIEFRNKLKKLIDSRNFASGNQFADSIYLPVIDYIDTLIGMSKTLNEIRESAFAIKEKSNAEIASEMDSAFQTLKISELEQIFYKLLYKDSVSLSSIELLKKMQTMYYGGMRGMSSFERYYNAYKLSKEAREGMGEYAGQNTTDRFMSEVFSREKSFIYGLFEEIYPFLLKDSSIVAFCKADGIKVPRIDGDTDKIFIELDVFLNSMRASIGKYRKATKGQFAATEFVDKELDYFSAFTNLAIALRNNDMIADQLKARNFLTQSKTMLQNNTKLLGMLDTLAECAKARVADLKDIVPVLEELRASAGEYLESQPVFNYKYLVAGFKSSRDLDEPSETSVAGESAITPAKQEEVAEPTRMDIANQKYAEYEALKDYVMKLKEYDDDDIVELKLYVENLSQELSQLISKEGISSEQLAEQVISMIDEFLSGDYAKKLDKFMYDINYHAQYELKELLAQEPSLQQREIISNISEKSGKFMERYGRLMQEADDGSLDDRKILSAYEKLADIKREIQKLYNIRFPDIDRFSKQQ